MFRSLFLYVAAVLLSLFIGKIYSIMWTKASIEEYLRLFKFYCLGTAVFMILLYLDKGYVGPRSSIAILALLGLIMLSGVRVSWRLAELVEFKENMKQSRTLIIGAGEAGAMLARDILRHDASQRIVGFIDEDPKVQDMYVASRKVLGRRIDLPRILTEERIDVVLIAIPSASGTQIQQYLDVLEHYNVSVRVLPSLLDLADGQVTVNRLRSVSLEDLLRRKPVKLDLEEISNLLRDKTVLITGAGGSIGSEICRQVLRREPKQVLALGHGEQSIYLLMESLSSSNNKVPVKPIIADVADPVTMEMIFREFKPDIVFHAAAHKHVPLMQENPREALRVNAFGTWNLAELSGKYDVARFVMISTDKAVNPSSIMGATKRAAERVLQPVQLKYPHTLYMTVRFGNVLGSRGSVVPKFEKQIEAGGPVTVTDKEMKRYFMLIPEAVSLVLQAGAMGHGGELFVLDMGEPVKIDDMARTLIRLHGYEPDKDIKVEYTGIRPGEKLYEELFYDPVHVDKTDNDKIFLSKLLLEEKSILPEIEHLLGAIVCGEIDDRTLRERIMALGCEVTNET
ncbi:polysaccharide biosynthesis protein [Synergistaceae bacterium OttesenSCG-928-D05]|nr:polysaccharide biosynthesis protein [Synergistaceae bacterium OttesenSCG-928-D05]